MVIARELGSQPFTSIQRGRAGSTAAYGSVPSSRAAWWHIEEGMHDGKPRYASGSSSGGHRCN